MATVEQFNHAKSFLKKSVEYLESAEVNLAAERYTPGTAMVNAAKAEPLVRRARALVELATAIVRLGA